MSRVRYFFVFAALIALATAFVACGGSSSKSGEDPQQVIDEATLKGIKSGNLDLSLGIKADGSEGGNLDVSLSGPFQSEGEGSEQLPELDMTAQANGSFNGEDINFEGGLTLLSDRAFVAYEGTEYAVDPTTFNFVKSAIEKNQKQGEAQGNSAGATACQEAAADLKVGNFVDNLSNEGSADVNGTTTTDISGDLNVPGAIDALLELTKNPACSAQLGAAGPLPSEAELDKAKGEVESALKKAHVDVFVGDDNIIRKIAAELSIEPSNGSGSGPKKIDLEFELSIDGVNEDQTIEAPSGAKPLSALFIKLGVNPIELLGALQGQGGLGGLSGAGGLGELLNGIGGGGGSSSGGGSGNTQAYLNCLKGARTPVDLQKCAGLK